MPLLSSVPCSESCRQLPGPPGEEGRERRPASRAAERVFLHLGRAGAGAVSQAVPCHLCCDHTWSDARKCHCAAAPQALLCTAEKACAASLAQDPD